MTNLEDEIWPRVELLQVEIWSTKEDTLGIKRKFGKNMILGGSNRYDFQQALRCHKISDWPSGIQPMERKK